MRQYIGLIHKDPDSEFGVSFPDFPGCVTAGATLDEMRDMAAEALAFHLEGLEADGAPIPEAFSLEAVMADPQNRDGVAILVPVPTQIAKAIHVMGDDEADTARTVQLSSTPAAGQRIIRPWQRPRSRV